MQLTIFESDMGDCLLLEANTGHLVLCDGGMKGSYEAHVRDALSALRDQNRSLNLVYVSHIDNDHIKGVLQLLEDEATWRAFDLHEANGDPVKPPKVSRPPEIKGILHNGFRDQLSANKKHIKNLKAVENALIAAAPALYATAAPDLIRAADEMQGIAAGIPEALKVSRLIAADALDIPLNQPPGSGESVPLLYAGLPGETFSVGSMQFTLIGPTHEELAALAEGWNTWLRNSPDRVTEIRRELKKRIEELSAGGLTGSPYDLRDWNGIPDTAGVTAPNVASLMFMVEEDRKRLLLTGDGQPDIILAGLKRAGFLDDGFLHVDVLKVPHHGSENNLHPEFARRVSADHYVFCGNGSHTNPDKRVIDRVYASRMGRASARALAPEAADRDFHFWFSTTSQAAPPGLERGETFAKLEKQVAKLEAKANGRLQVHYNTGSAIALTV